MKRLFLCLLAATLLAGCGGGQLVISDQPEPADSTATAAAITPFPTLAPTAPYQDNSDDTLTVVLGGLYTNGGYWAWADIVNLLGVYDQPEAYVTSTVGGVDYSGVPLPYLLRYARLSDTALATAVFTRADQRYSFPTSQLRDCMTCLIVRAADDTLTLVLPPVQPSVIEQLVRIESR